MFLLAAGLVIRDRLRGAESEAAPSALTRTANTLIGNMGLLFVPAGVGVMAELGVLRQDWLPILAGLMVSTVLGVVVTGLVMHHVSRRVEGPVMAPPCWRCGRRWRPRRCCGWR